jgi:hypothetical protein
MTTNDEAPPIVTLPGDNPEVDRIVETLKRADAPLAPRSADPQKRGSEAAVAAPRAAPPAGQAPAQAPRAPQALRAPQAARAPLRPAWIGLAVLSIVGPVVALALGLLYRTRPPEIVVVTAPAVASSPTLVAPPTASTSAPRSPPVETAPPTPETREASAPTASASARPPLPLHPRLPVSSAPKAPVVSPDFLQ